MLNVGLSSLMLSIQAQCAKRNSKRLSALDAQKLDLVPTVKDNQSFLSFFSTFTPQFMMLVKTKGFEVKQKYRC